MRHITQGKRLVVRPRWSIVAVGFNTLRFLVPTVAYVRLASTPWGGVGRQDCARSLISFGRQRRKLLDGLNPGNLSFLGSQLVCFDLGQDFR